MILLTNIEYMFEYIDPTYYIAQTDRERKTDSCVREETDIS